ncbi:hypothetical protein RQ831_21465 [Roseomonas gilardii]|uniref:Uncharacterized protein n=1 Tax=Roseomonas gilardii TaxID=257708 RepID=A0ABU3MLE0_9PROT|nr:hypothetical protein [Roseomonas gilardii]MDT8333627.1 hypothetical protein [Roseomonas gilardii]
MARLSLESRHFMIATATILTGAPILRRPFRYFPGSRQDDLATIHHHLTNADRDEWQQRQCRWPGFLSRWVAHDPDYPDLGTKTHIRSIIFVKEP